jgi:surface antigen
MRAFLLGLLIVACHSAASPAAQAGQFLDAPASLPRGEMGLVRLDAGAARICSLAATSGGTRQGPFVYRIADPIVTFRWRIPATARRATWKLAVRCAGKARRLSRAKPISVRVTVQGARKGKRRLLKRGSLRIATAPRSPIVGLPSPADEAGKGGFCSSADNGYRSVLDASSYCSGYCTAYAWTRRPDAALRGLGNAVTWYARAAAKGIPVGSRPVVGAIAWWDGRVGGGFGHVAYVEAVTASSVTVAEMNVAGWNRESRRTIALGGGSAPHGYIYGGSAGSGAAPPPPSSPPSSPPPAARPDRMSMDARLHAASNEYLQSADGRYRFVMQQDGNLVLYGPSGRALWASNTVGRGAHHLRMQGDGNLVIYNGADKPVWASGTPRHYSTFLVVQNDGNVVIYNGGTPIWTTGTDGRT